MRRFRFGRPAAFRGLASIFGAALGLVLLTGCVAFGPTRLVDDQVGYSSALSESQKKQTLLNIVRIRYGDSAVFLNTTQIISGYQLQKSASSGFQIFPALGSGNMFNGGGGIQLQQSPTFTFEPVTGQDLAQSVMRPLSPTEVLPLSLSGTPIDLLFRLAVQSINGYDNSEFLGSVNRPGSLRFFQLLSDLRQLQVSNLLGVRLQPQNGPENPNAQLLLTISDTTDPTVEKVVAETREILGLPRTGEDAPVVYGRLPQRAGQVAMLTRPMLGVLSQVALEVKAPAKDVELGRTVRSIDDRSLIQRPAVIVYSGDKPSDDAFTQVQYRGRWFWISNDDFESKLAFSLVQLLLTLAQTKEGPGTLITIPAH